MILRILILALLSAVLSAKALAGDIPNISYCETLAGETDAPLPTTPVAVPSSWTAFTEVSKEWIAFSTNKGATYCLDLGWIEEITSFDRINERFVGLDWYGYETFGYKFIDLAGTGTEIDTGSRPVFSPNGRLFANISRSEAGWGAFEGFAVYEVNRGGIHPLHVDTDPSIEFEPRVEGWEGDDCVIISAIDYSALLESAQAEEAPPRVMHHARRADGWKLMQGKCPSRHAQ